jgi:hypothetical protein
MQWVVCDIDGVLADPTHRLHHITGETKDWDAFFQACKNDAPRMREIEVLRCLSYGRRVCLLTGRSLAVQKATVEWLSANRVSRNCVYMRPIGDHRPDHEVKPELLQQFMAECDLDTSDILCVIEDRRAVVDMWREMGLLCLQNAPGEF